MEMLLKLICINGYFYRKCKFRHEKAMELQLYFANTLALKRKLLLMKTFMNNLTE